MAPFNTVDPASSVGPTKVTAAKRLKAGLCPQRTRAAAGPTGGRSCQMQGPPRVLPRSGPHQLTPALPAQGRAGKGARGLACSPPGPPAGHINSGAESLITIWLFPSSSFQFFRSKGPAQMSLLVPFCQSGRGRQRRGRRVGRASSGLPTPQGGGSGHLSAPRPVGSGHDACGSSSLV